MKVLLTGATGYLGSEIARQLVRDGHEVRVLVRKTSKLEGLAGLALERVEGDLLDAAAIARALDGRQALIHTAGATSGRRRDTANLYRVNVDGVRVILDAAARIPGLRVVHTSTVAAVGAAREARTLDESATWNLGGLGYDYAESKHQGEELALARARDGLDLVVLNPGMIFGPGDVYLTSTKYVLEYLNGRNRFAVRGGLSFCDVRDVAQAHVAALTRGRAGERYILAGHNLTHRELLDGLYRLTGRYRPIALPGAALMLFAVLSELVARIRPHALDEVTLGVARVAQMYLFFDVSRAQRELGYALRPIAGTLRDTLDDFVARGLTRGAIGELSASP